MYLLTRVLLLELLQQLHLLLLVTGRATHLLLSLIVHHLLDHGTSLTIEIAQAGVLGGDLGHVDLGRRLDDMRPPFHLVHLVEMDADLLARGLRCCLESPGRLIDEDGMGEIALDRGNIS